MAYRAVGAKKLPSTFGAHDDPHNNQQTTEPSVPAIVRRDHHVECFEDPSGGGVARTFCSWQEPY
jgi:hypothetical protein